MNVPLSGVAAPRRVHADWPFLLGLGVLGGTYVVLIVGMLLAQILFTTPDHLWNALANEEIQYATQLSLLSCSLTALFSLWVAVPLGYLMARCRFPGKQLLDALLDIPIVLPPLVIGLALLILFGVAPLQRMQQVIPITFAIPSVVIAQFAVAAAFATRTMRVTFDQISPRTEQVALTLGCSRSQAFWMVTLPQARRGILTAGTLAWARSLGEFGPILIFSGSTPLRTEVLPTSIWLQFETGNLEGGVAVSLLMIAAAVVVLIITRVFGLRGSTLP